MTDGFIILVNRRYCDGWFWKNKIIFYSNLSLINLFRIRCFIEKKNQSVLIDC